MKKCISIYLYSFTILFSCQITPKPKPIISNENMVSVKKEISKQNDENKKLASKIQFNYFVIKAESKTFGYDVYADGNLYLHQPSIPGLSGNNGFADTASAGRVARLVIKKIKKGEIPPTIELQELKKLKVLH